MILRSALLRPSFKIQGFHRRAQFKATCKAGFKLPQSKLSSAPAFSPEILIFGPRFSYFSFLLLYSVLKFSEIYIIHRTIGMRALLEKEMEKVLNA